jgi:hypothetical protein
MVLLTGFDPVQIDLGRRLQHGRLAASDSATSEDDGRTAAADVTPVFPKETKCIHICMPRSSFMHIVTYKCIQK